MKQVRAVETVATAITQPGFSCILCTNEAKVIFDGSTFCKTCLAEARRTGK
jgi:hypothetical protein